MSGSGGVSIARTRGENRFYVSPAMRKQQLQLQQQQQQQKQQQNQQQQQQQRPLNSKNSTVEMEKRTTESDQCGTLSSSSSMSNCSVSGRVGNEVNSTNLDRFLEFTTPVVPAQYFPKTSIRGWRTQEREAEIHPYFMLGDLWESFKEWSAYGAGVPLLLDGSESVMQYYVPSLSGIQLYVDPSRPSPRLRKLGDESDAESSRETSSDGSSDYGADRGVSNGFRGPMTQQNTIDSNIQSLNRLKLRSKPLRGSSSDECEVSYPPGRLIFEYMEHASPFTREPLFDKITALATQFPELRTYTSCDLSPSSWISVAWYPIYRIPMGPTLQNLDACFLTFHSLSTPFQSLSTDAMYHGSGTRGIPCAEASFKLPLSTFGLASYKFKVSFWNPNGVHESQKVNSLLRAADNWLRLLQVNHPDYTFFISHNSSWR